MNQQQRCNATLKPDLDACTPSESEIEEPNEDELDTNDQRDEEEDSKERQEQDEFAKRWDDINYLIRKQFCCK